MNHICIARKSGLKPAARQLSRAENKNGVKIWRAEFRPRQKKD
jgi:hypothetical protein